MKTGPLQTPDFQTTAKGSGGGFVKPGKPGATASGLRRKGPFGSSGLTLLGHTRERAARYVARGSLVFVLAA